MSSQVKTPHYAFYANTWDGTGGGNSYRQFNQAYYLVSIPDGNRALAHNHATPKFAGISPDGHKSIVYDTFGRKVQTGSIIQIWEGTTQTFTFDHSLTYPYRWSPDSKYLTAGIVRPICNCDDYALDVGVVDVATGALRALTDGEFFMGTIDWSPDSQFLAYESERFNVGLQQHEQAIKIIPIDGSQPPRTVYTLISKGETPSLQLHWLPGGNHLALVTKKGGITEMRHIDLHTGQVTYYHLWFDYVDICWSTTTDHFLLASMTRSKLITPDTAQSLDVSFVDPSVWQLDPGSTFPCAWSPDGSKLALVYSVGYPIPPRVKVIDFAARQVTDIDVGEEASFWSPYWSHDSRLLALKSYEPSRSPNDVYFYDTTTMQRVMGQTNLEFIAWIASAPP